MIALWILQATFSLVSTVNRVQKVTELHEIQPERISAQIVQQTISAASVPDQSPHCMEVTYGSCVSVSLSCLACLYFSISVVAQPSSFKQACQARRCKGCLVKMTPWILVYFITHSVVCQSVEDKLIYVDSTCWWQNIPPKIIKEMSEHTAAIERNLQIICMWNKKEYFYLLDRLLSACSELAHSFCSSLFSLQVVIQAGWVFYHAKFWYLCKRTEYLLYIFVH